jgi:hypothetical protein
LMTESTPQHRKVCELFTMFFFTCHPVLTKFPALPEARSSLWNLAIPSPTYSSQSSSTTPRPRSSGSSSRVRPLGLRSSRISSQPVVEADNQRLFDLIEDVSARVDRTTQGQTRLLANNTKKTAKSYHSSSSAVRSDGHGKEKSAAPVAGHRNRLNSGSPASDICMDVDPVSTMDLRSRTTPAVSSQPTASTSYLGTHQSSDRAPMLPPPVPKPKPKPNMQVQPQIIHQHKQPRSANPSPPVKIHPPLPPSGHQRPHQPKPEPIPLKAKHVPSSARQHPRGSQLASRPPPLGMRRVSPYPTFSPSQMLSDKQKNFNPSLIKPSHASVQASSSSMSPTPRQALSAVEPRSAVPSAKANEGKSLPGCGSSQNDATMESEPVVVERQASSPVTDADSSYDDMSFDLEALEETMRQYD